MPVKIIPLEEMNSLARARHEANLSRTELSLRCRSETTRDTEHYTLVSSDSIRRLELGLTKPRAKTAQTLAKALGLTVEELFPDGLDHVVRNPDGVTRIASGRAKRAMARNHNLAWMLIELVTDLDIPYFVVLGPPPKMSSQVTAISFSVYYPDLDLIVIAAPTNNKIYRIEKELFEDGGWTWIETSEQEIKNSFASLAVRVLVEVVHIQLNDFNNILAEKGISLSET